MIAWTTVEDAIHAWVVAGSGLPASRVIWAQQNSPRPEAPFIALNIISVRRVGRDWLDVEDADTPSAGAEIEHNARGMREALLSLQCFEGDATGDSNPRALLDAVVATVILPTRRDALNTAGVGIATTGPVQSVGGVRGESVFEPRATLEVRIFLASEVTEAGTYIESVEIENESTGDTFTV